MDTSTHLFPRDAVSLTQQLIRFESVNPPGNEAKILAFLEEWLIQFGFQCERTEFGPGRGNLLARYGPQDNPICLSGHLDVVPLGAQPWTRPAFEPQIDGDRLYGRGSSDMKAGVAAMLQACLEFTKSISTDVVKRGILIILTGGEETGCDGARSLVNHLKQRVGLLLIPEPSSNRPLIGHKGALWLRLKVKGITAHGSMPERGDNAVYRLANIIRALAQAEWPGESHPVLGKTTLNVGRVGGGLNINSVPDEAWADIDIRTVGTIDHEQVKDWVHKTAGEKVSLETMIDLPAVLTPESNSVIQKTLQDISIGVGSQNVSTVSYFTDGAILRPLLGDCPFMVIGPGEAHMAHQTDEYCLISKIREAVSLYRSILTGYCLANG